MKKGIIIAVVVLVALVGGVFAYTAMNNDDTSSNSEQRSIDDDIPANTQPPTVDQPAETISYTNNGFEPNTMTVKVGSNITVKNNSSEDMQFSSDDHPTHLKNNELNGGVLAPGGSRTFTVTKTGTYGVHDHLNSSQTMTLTVQ